MTMNQDSSGLQVQESREMRRENRGAAQEVCGASHECPGTPKGMRLRVRMEDERLSIDGLPVADRCWKGDDIALQVAREFERRALERGWMDRPWMLRGTFGGGESRRDEPRRRVETEFLLEVVPGNGTLQSWEIWIDGGYEGSFAVKKKESECVFSSVREFLWANRYAERLFDGERIGIGEDGGMEIGRMN